MQELKGSQILLMEEAEIYLQQEDSEKAKETLQLLIQENPKSVYLAKAKQMLELL